jgi:hypothetical protein
MALQIMGTGMHTDSALQSMGTGTVEIYMYIRIMYTGTVEGGGYRFSSPDNDNWYFGYIYGYLDSEHRYYGYIISSQYNGHRYFGYR